MKIDNRTGLFLFCLLIFIVSGCSSDYQVDFVFTGTVQEKLEEEQLLVMKESGGEDEGRREGNIYEIPVDNVELYDIGQKLKITVLSNTVADVWDLNHMKFEIEEIEK